jgi:hypothetical protein
VDSKQRRTRDFVLPTSKTNQRRETTAPRRAARRPARNAPVRTPRRQGQQLCYLSNTGGKLGTCLLQNLQTLMGQSGKRLWFWG